jgi:hypothetical protein
MKITQITSPLLLLWTCVCAVQAALRRELNESRARLEREKTTTLALRSQLRNLKASQERSRDRSCDSGSQRGRSVGSRDSSPMSARSASRMARNSGYESRTAATVHVERAICCSSGGLVVDKCRGVLLSCSVARPDPLHTTTRDQPLPPGACPSQSTDNTCNISPLTPCSQPTIPGVE